MLFNWIVEFDPLPRQTGQEVKEVVEVLIGLNMLSRVEAKVQEGQFPQAANHPHRLQTFEHTQAVMQCTEPCHVGH